MTTLEYVEQCSRMSMQHDVHWEERVQRRQKALEWFTNPEHYVKRRTLRTHLEAVVKDLMNRGVPEDAPTQRVITAATQFGSMALVRTTRPTTTRLEQCDLSDLQGVQTDDSLQQLFGDLPHVIVPPGQRSSDPIVTRHLLVTNGDRTLDHLEVRRTLDAHPATGNVLYTLHTDTIQLCSTR
jgi:hypothetical protein